MKIIAIVAADRNWAIGKSNGLLYSLHKDMRHFKKITTGHFVVCGYNTLLSFPGQQPLKNRLTICLAPDGVERNDCIIVHSLDRLLSTMKEIGPEADFYVIGGGMLYNSMLPYYDGAIVTKVDATDPDATVFFPDLDKDGRFGAIDETPSQIDGDYSIKFVVYRRLH